MKTQRAQHEIEHGKFLSSGNAESTWGWGSPAGQIRAQRRAAMLINATKMKKNIKVLEVGCGTGMFTEIFSKTDANILAVDISPELLEKARARKSWPHSVSFIAKGFEECNVDGPFDIILGSSILHHLEIQASLEKIFQMLSPGGIVSFAEPNMLNPQIFLQKNIPWLKRLMGDSPDETAFVRWQLSGLLKKIGFRNIQITPFDWLHPATPRLLIEPVSFLGRLAEKIPFIREFSGSLIIRAEKP